MFTRKNVATAAKGTAAGLMATTALGLAAPAQAEMQDYTIDSVHSVVAFMVSHIGYADALGRFNEFEGTLRYDAENNELGDISVSIDPTSLDLGGSSEAAKDRYGHLMSEDFLNTDEYGEITFEMTEAVKLTENRGVVKGDLTMLGQTNEVVLDVTRNKAERYPYGGGEFSEPPFVVGISARGELQRSDWGITYGVDNGIVGDTVELIIEMEAQRDREQ